MSFYQTLINDAAQLQLQDSVKNKVTYLLLIDPDWAERRVFFASVHPPSAGRYLAAFSGGRSWDLRGGLSWMRSSWPPTTGCRWGVKLWPRFLQESLSCSREKILPTAPQRAEEQPETQPASVQFITTVINPWTVQRLKVILIKTRYEWPEVIHNES